MLQKLKLIFLLGIFGIFLVRPVRDVCQWLYSCVCALKVPVKEGARMACGYVAYACKYFFEPLECWNFLIWMIVCFCMAGCLYVFLRCRPLSVVYGWLCCLVRWFAGRLRNMLRPLSPYIYDCLARMEPRSIICRWLKGRLFQRVARKGGICVTSLTPRSDLRDIDGYSKMLTEAFRNVDIRNIAVSGRYGAGKSSFLRTYFKNRNVLWVSLASFVNQSSSESQSLVGKGERLGKDECLTEQLEWSILQQMFYAAHANEIPLSRFNRIARSGGWLAVLISVYIIVSIGVTLVVFQPNFISNVMRYFPLLQTNAVKVFAVYALPMLLSGGLIGVVWVIVQCRLDVSMSVKGVGVSLTKDAKTSAFNRRLDELIYYFETLSYEAVIFEDIDRFQRPIVFTRLREINTILNNSRQIGRRHKPIRFVYALRDDVFRGDMRVKFFDFILPIYPFMNVDIAYAQVESDLIDVLGVALSEELQNFIRCVSSFISDMRFWNNIVNEIRLFCFVSQGERDVRKVLAMILFKNIFPTDFDLAHEGKGLLVQVLSHDGPLVKRAQEKIRQLLKDKEQQAAELRLLKAKPSEIAEYEKAVVATREKLSGIQYESMVRLIAQSIVQREDLMAVVKERFSEQDPFLGDDGLDMAVSFLFMLLETGALEADYADYLSLVPVKRLPLPDREFIRGCILGQPPVGQTLHSPYGVIGKLDATVFAKTNIFDVTIAKSLRKACQRNHSDTEMQRKLSAYIRRLSSETTIEKAEYFYELLQSCPGVSVRDFWCNGIRKHNPGILEALIGIERFDELRRQNVIACFLGARLRADIESELTARVCSYVNGIEDIELFIKCTSLADNQVVHWLVANKAEFVCPTFLKLTNVAIRKAIVDRGLYQLNASVVEALLKDERANSAWAKEPYGAILSGSCVSLREKVQRDRTFFFKEVYPRLLYGEKAVEAKDTVLKVVQDTDISDECKASFLDANYLNLAPDTAWSDENLRIMLGHDSFAGTWENVLMIYDRLGYSGDLRDMLMRRSDVLVRDKCNPERDEMKSLLCEMIEDEEFNETTLLKLLASVNSGERLVYKGDKIAPKRFVTLKKSLFVEFTPEYYSALKKAGKGTHLSLIRSYTKLFLAAYQEDWLDHNDAMALLSKGQDGQISAVGIVALRKASSLLARDSEVCELLAGNIKVKDFEGKSYYSKMQKEMLLDYYSNSTLRAYALVLKDRSADATWDCLTRFPGAVRAENGDVETITVKISIKIAQQFCKYVEKGGFAVRISDSARMPEVVVSRERAR